MSLKRLLPRCDTSRSNKAERPMAPIWAPLRGCLKSPGRSRLTVQESGFVPAASRVEWRNIVGENDGIGTFQTPSKQRLAAETVKTRGRYAFSVLVWPWFGPHLDSFIFRGSVPAWMAGFWRFHSSLRAAVFMNRRRESCPWFPATKVRPLRQSGRRYLPEGRWPRRAGYPC